MGIDKLLDKLHKYLDRGEKKDHATELCDQIDTLLEKIGEKEKKLQKQMAHEKNKHKKRHLKLELKMISLQRKKGIKRRKELEGSC